MTVSQEEYDQWLASQNEQRCVLLEMEYTEKPVIYDFNAASEEIFTDEFNRTTLAPWVDNSVGASTVAATGTQLSLNVPVTDFAIADLLKPVESDKWYKITAVDGGGANYPNVSIGTTEGGSQYGTAELAATATEITFKATQEDLFVRLFESVNGGGLVESLRIDEVTALDGMVAGNGAALEVTAGELIVNNSITDFGYGAWQRDGVDGEAWVVFGDFTKDGVSGNVRAGATPGGFELLNATVAASGQFAVSYVPAADGSVYLSLMTLTTIDDARTIWDNIKLLRSLVKNGSFDLDAVWSKGPGWTISGGAASHAAGTASGISQNIGETVAGRQYPVMVIISGMTTGAINAALADTDGTNQATGKVRSDNGTYVETISANTGNELIMLNCDSTFDGDVELVFMPPIKTAYLANRPYVSNYTDTMPNIGYQDSLATAVDIESRIDGTFTLGQISVLNDGSNSDWINRTWLGHSIAVLLGDPTWSRDDFRTTVLAINGGLLGAVSDVLRFGTYDAKARFDKPLQPEKLVDGLPVPISKGEPFNVLPALTNTTTHEYQVNESSITSADPRDNGADLTETADYGNGKFTLAARPLGEIGCDVVEADDTAKEIIDWLCDRCGETADQTLLDALPTYKLGLYYDVETSAAQVLDDVCASLGAYWRIGAVGVLEVLQMQGPGATDLTIDADQVVERGLQLLRTLPPVSKLQLNYKRNFNVHNRESLAGIIPTDAALAEDLSAEWRSVYASNALPAHLLPVEDEVNTYLTVEADAQAEADRLADLYAVRREIWEIDCYLTPAEAKVGQTVRLVNQRYGFEGGINCLIVGVRRDLTSGRVVLEVFK